MSTEENKPRIITEASRNQFQSTYRMLTVLVDNCPDQIWYENKHGIAFWYHIFHVVYYIDYWFRDSYDDSEFRSMVFDERIKPDFELQPNAGISISKTDMEIYLQKIARKTERIFSRLDDEILARPIQTGVDHYTYTDVIIGQIRHIMYNLGYLNSILRENGAPESDWYAYNEN